MLLRLRGVGSRGYNLATLLQFLQDIVIVRLLNETLWQPYLLEVLDGLRESHLNGHRRLPADLVLGSRDVGASLLGIVLRGGQFLNG